MGDLFYRSGTIERRAKPKGEAESPVEDRTLDFICSTDDVDSYGDIIEQDSWILDRFLQNPVGLFEHGRSGGYFGDVEPEDRIPIGTWENVRVEKNMLKGTLRFATAAVSELAERVYQAYREGVMRAVSVGFRPRDVASEKVDDREITRFSNCELYEISCVALPANPEAVVEARKKSLEQFRAHNRQRAARAATEPTPMDKPLSSAVAELVIVPSLPLSTLSAVLLCEPTEAACIRAATDATQKAAKLEAELAAFKAKAAVGDAAVGALGLGGEGATVTEAAIAKSVIDLQSKAKSFDEIEPLFKAAQTELAAKVDEAIKAEVAWVAKCGEKSLYGVKGGSVKALEVYRRNDPAGFAEEFKAAIDGRKAYDDTQVFKPLSTGNGPLSTDVTKSLPTSTGDSASFDDRVEALLAAKAAANTPILRSQAIEMIATNKTS